MILSTKKSVAKERGTPKRPISSIVDRVAKRQADFLLECINSDQHLSAALADKGKTYDDLRYYNTYRQPERSERIHSLEDFQEKANGIPTVSFFSGAGGLDLGLEAAGFSHELLVEKVPLFCQTLLHNRPSWEVKDIDVSNFELASAEIIKAIGTKKNFEGLFVGGPPCQPFSIAANQRFSRSDENFKRVGFAHATNGNLLFDYIDLICRFRPRAFLIENVPGLIDVDGGEQLEEAYRKLENAGYLVNQPLILKANNYFVPQQRIRLFIVGTRMKRHFIPPVQSTTSMAVGGIFEQSLEKAKNHVTREHSAESVLRYMMLEYGERDQLGRVDRLNPLLPSKTVIAGGNAGGGRSHLHPYIPRTLSVRECARIQTFPEDFEFLGPVARQFTQVGNAVPPVLGAQLGSAILRSYFI